MTTQRIDQCSISIRVRYAETDAMGFLHHSQYTVYFEMGRTELLRLNGGNYRQMEQDGLFFVVVSLETQFRKPAHYDDVLQLVTEVDKITPAKLKHKYALYRGEELLAEGKSVLACVDREGTVQRLTDEILFG